MSANTSSSIAGIGSLHVELFLSEQVKLLYAGLPAALLANLLSNAAKFSSKGGEVEVRATLHGERVRIAVTDHGPGVPDEFRDRIFQKFSQADASDSREKGGSGLGLAISLELVERMRGTIGFDSVAGEGACFFVDLPVHADRQSGGDRA